ncbi:hypothetical protein EFL77_09010 [Pediococcus pentosaceus]|uniref:hypothetical protein n=1 Tax=Pediococcus pentosaceus TaxID=1255 RepID=UPI00223B9AE7|nr:hypothetical protein [Pediococcus pentosaceus]MCT1178635.1 hypothetical protein [Pediococcus pentosaceus]
MGIMWQIGQLLIFAVVKGVSNAIVSYIGGGSHSGRLGQMGAKNGASAIGNGIKTLAAAAAGFGLGMLNKQNKINDQVEQDHKQDEQGSKNEKPNPLSPNDSNIPDDPTNPKGGAGDALNDPNLEEKRKSRENLVKNLSHPSNGKAFGHGHPRLSKGLSTGLRTAAAVALGAGATVAATKSMADSLAGNKSARGANTLARGLGKKMVGNMQKAMNTLGAQQAVHNALDHFRPGNSDEGDSQDTDVLKSSPETDSEAEDRKNVNDDGMEKMMQEERNEHPEEFENAFDPQKAALLSQNIPTHVLNTDTNDALGKGLSSNPMNSENSIGNGELSGAQPVTDSENEDAINTGNSLEPISANQGELNKAGIKSIDTDSDGNGITVGTNYDIGKEGFSGASSALSGTKQENDMRRMVRAFKNQDEGAISDYKKAGIRDVSANSDGKATIKADPQLAGIKSIATDQSTGQALGKGFSSMPMQNRMQRVMSGKPKASKPVSDKMPGQVPTKSINYMSTPGGQGLQTTSMENYKNNTAISHIASKPLPNHMSELNVDLSKEVLKRTDFANSKYGQNLKNMMEVNNNGKLADYQSPDGTGIQSVTDNGDGVKVIMHSKDILNAGVTSAGASVMFKNDDSENNINVLQNALEPFETTNSENTQELPSLDDFNSEHIDGQLDDLNNLSSLEQTDVNQKVEIQDVGTSGHDAG